MLDWMRRDEFQRECEEMAMTAVIGGPKRKCKRCRKHEMRRRKSAFEEILKLAEGRSTNLAEAQSRRRQRQIA